MILARKGSISQREGPRYHRIFLTSLVLIKRKTRRSSTCLGIGRHFKLLCACANVATTWHSMYQVDSFSGFPLGNEASTDHQIYSICRANAFSVGGRLLRLFTPQAAEASRSHPSFSVGSGCVELSAFREDKCPPKTSQKQDQKTFPTSFYILCMGNVFWSCIILCLQCTLYSCKPVINVAYLSTSCRTGDSVMDTQSLNLL